MRLARVLKPFAVVAVLAAAGAGGYATRDRWQTLLAPADPPAVVEPDEVAAPIPTGKVIVNEQAQKNLGLTAKPLKPQTYWRTIPVPGMVVDRPGRGDRSVVAPVTGVVTQINRVPGEAVRPGEVLFTLRLLSETLRQTQADLFKATQDIALVEAQRKRLTATAGAVPESRVIDLDHQLARLQAVVTTYRQELQFRGLTPDQVAAAAAGRYVTELPVVAPAAAGDADPSPGPSPVEVQELKVELGQQVQAGQTLCLLANHQMLAVEGRAFRDETPLLERSVAEGWPVGVDFQEDPAAGWGEVKQTFHIRHLANTIDPATRTFAFRLPLENESRAVTAGGHTQTLWRFRPGQRVRLLVRVERLDDVFVLPADAVARDGPEAFVFTQNVNTFTRKPVRVLAQDRTQAVVANDGSLRPGSYAVQGGAAQLNRLIKAGSASGVPKGYHMHADGSLHKNEDEGK